LVNPKQSTGRPVPQARAVLFLTGSASAILDTDAWAEYDGLPRMTNHSDDELQQLSKFYARMSDGELQRIAADTASLTEVAQQALVAEINRRGIGSAEPEPAATPTKVDFRQLVTLRKFRDLPEALLAKGSLESAGIESFLGDDNMVRMDWFISNLLGGIKLQVKPEDAEAADEILNQPIPEGFDVEGVGGYEQPRCPKCQSLDVAFEELNKPIAYGSAWVGLPLPVHREAWRCHSCHYEWPDDLEEPEESTLPPS
jgi:hypothetical protein